MENGALGCQMDSHLSYSPVMTGANFTITMSHSDRDDGWMSPCASVFTPCLSSSLWRGHQSGITTQYAPAPAVGYTERTQGRISQPQSWDYKCKVLISFFEIQIFTVNCNRTHLSDSWRIFWSVKGIRFCNVSWHLGHQFNKRVVYKPNLIIDYKM